MLPALEVFPLFLNILVLLELGIALGLLEARALERGNELGEQQRVHTFPLILGVNGHKKEIDSVDMAEQWFEREFDSKELNI